MAGPVIDLDGFEAMFRADIDPWNYRTSRFEAVKRGVLVRACGLRPFGRALELACANGETTRALAGRCLRLLAVDGSPSAVAGARARTKGVRRVVVRQVILPGGMPRGAFDLIVVSEILYYLGPRDFATLVGKIGKALAPGGRVVLLHHIVGFDDASIHPRLAQHRAVRALRRHAGLAFRRRCHRFEVAALVKRRG